MSAEFATDAEAREASIDLDEAWGTSSHWLVVPTADLGNYDLVA